MAHKINIITIQPVPDQRVEYAFENGSWSRSVITTEVADGIKEVTTSTAACSAEDVIVALLLGMSQKDVEIYVRERRGTAVSAQCWQNAFGRWSDSPYTWFNRDSELEIG